MSLPSASRSQPWVLVALALLLCAAAWLRLDALGQGTLGHIESYTPGIVYPEGISDPPSRLDQTHNLLWAINDVHGPFWYLWMLPYTQAFGTSLTAMRFPSALLGLAAIGLTFLIGRRAAGPWTGLLAAMLLTVGGHHLYWSRQARFYSSACFFAVLSTWLLLRLAEGRGRWTLAAYLATTFAGLTTIYYYWPVALAQLLWMLAREARRGLGVSGWQLWLFTAATPILTLAIYQARPGPYLAYGDWRFLGGYFTFGFLLEPNIDAGSMLAWKTPLTWLLPVVALVCLTLGLWALRGARTGVDAPSLPAPPTLLMGLTAALAAVSILWAGGLAGQAFPHKVPLLRLSAVFPLLGFGAYLLLNRFAGLVPGLGPMRSPLGLAAALGLAPALLIAAIGQVIPFYAPRGMLCFTPFLFIVLARGVTAMGSPGVGLATVLAMASFGSVRVALADPGAIDYAGLAEQWLPRIQDSDRIFIAPHWSVTPELYYLQSRYGQVTGRDWLSSDAPRVWVIVVPGAPVPEGFARALEVRERVLTLRAAGIEVTLFVNP